MRRIKSKIVSSNIKLTAIIEYVRILIKNRPKVFRLKIPVELYYE